MAFSSLSGRARIAKTRVFGFILPAELLEKSFSKHGLFALDNGLIKLFTYFSGYILRLTALFYSGFNNNKLI